MESAKWKLRKLNPTNAADQEALKKVVAHLDKGVKTIALLPEVYQNGQSFLARMTSYEKDELALDSDDENACSG